MAVFNWLASMGAWLHLDGHWDLLTLGLAFATLVYVAVALAVSFHGDRAARQTEAIADQRVGSIKRMAQRPFSRPASLA